MCDTTPTGGRRRRPPSRPIASGAVSSTNLCQRLVPAADGANGHVLAGEHPPVVQVAVGLIGGDGAKAPPRRDVDVGGLHLHVRPLAVDKQEEGGLVLYQPHLLHAQPAPYRVDDGHLQPLTPLELQQRGLVEGLCPKDLFKVLARQREGARHQLTAKIRLCNLCEPALGP